MDVFSELLVLLEDTDCFCKMLAAMLRQEAARIAHENAVQKRHGIVSAKVRQGISEWLRRP
jgi:hypothetical protein